MSILLLLLTTNAMAQRAQHKSRLPAHLSLGDLEMTGPEYERLIENKNLMIPTSDDGSDPLRVILNVGKRNLDWLTFINSRRDSQNKLELSTPETQQGIPITSPRISNRTMIADGWEGLKETLSSVVYDVLINQKSFTTDLGVSDEQFLREIRSVDHYYQRASRWLLQEPYLDMYARESIYDVRGYYYLQQEPDLAEKLNVFDTLTEAKRNDLRTWLVMECVNATSIKSTCEADFNTAVQSHKVLEYHQQYVILAQDMWDSFFRIDAFRNDVTWTSQQPNKMVIPFRDPQAPAVSAWLSDNIQDEFRWGGWALNLSFQPNGDDSMTHIVFKEGATPHVNELAGSEITMDGNRHINEYSSRWTIRHEYGHVLGLPDCYIEFYDREAEVMINYQLDITNLMCSRRGKFQQKHFDELKRVYLH
jgi:hypothetical protein